MPKKIVTERTIPIILNEIDKWPGKLTWERLTEKLAEVLGEKKISRHTLLKYPVIVESFNQKKERQRGAREVERVDSGDVTLEFAKREIERLENKVSRLEWQNQLFVEQFVRWQRNLHMMPGVDLDKLNDNLDKPLPSVQRR